jgi:hypothetical protein
MHAQPSYELLEIKGDSSANVSVRMRLSNNVSEPLLVGVSEDSQRLSGTFAFVEQLSKNGKWVKPVPPEGRILGDVPPRWRQIDPGKDLVVWFTFNVYTLGLSRFQRLRIVVLSKKPGTARGTDNSGFRFITPDFEVGKRK